MKKLFYCFYGLLAVGCAVVLGGIGYFDAVLPERVSVERGRAFCVGAWVQSTPLSSDGAVRTALVGEQYRAQLRLAGLFPVKEVTVTVTDQRTVMVCGTPFGIKMYTDGVLVVGLSDVTTAAGSANPAASAGVRVGDVIVAVNGQEVTTSRQVSHLIREGDGGRLALRLRRDGVVFDATVTPARTESGYQIGMWIRDSAAGVGTLTFYDPATGAFGGLGHAVCDVDTGQVMPLGSGEVVPARVFGIVKGKSGTPGELKGCFEPGTLGQLRHNGTQGLYGTLTVFPIGAVSMPVASRQQVHTGEAQILCTLDGTKPQYYDVILEKVRTNRYSESRHMVVQVVDPDLLALTGGIVQGMSGSPIIQDGRLVGAVTHVLIDDPTRGYGLLAEDMLEMADGVEKETNKDAA